jgi:N-methylhydantoinase B/oxoprolinase/acetone carboxylase alpha subunit
LQDLKTIVKGLEVYKINTGSYPNPNSTAAASGWEVSTDGTSATDFLSALRTGGAVSRVPVDPRNYGGLPNLTPTRASTSFEYFYYKYTAGTNGCPASQGDYYVLGATRMDGVASGGNSPANPGFSCSGRDWVTTGAWVTGAYTN